MLLLIRDSQRLPRFTYYYECRSRSPEEYLALSLRMTSLKDRVALNHVTEVIDREGLLPDKSHVSPTGPEANE